MEKLSHAIIRRKRLIILAWVVAGLVGLGLTPVTVGNLSESYATPGLAAFDANREIVERYGTGGQQRPFVPVIELPAGQTADSPQVTAALGKAFAAVSRDLNQARTVSYAGTGDGRFVGSDGRTTFGLVYPGPIQDGSPPGGGLGEVPDVSGDIRTAMTPHLPQGSTLKVTGLDTLAPGADAGGVNVPLKIGIGSLAAVVILLLVFRSALALVPLLIALVAVPVSFFLLLGLTYLTDVHEVALQILPLLGLGIAVDYSLLLVTRWREEQAAGVHGEEAVHNAMRTAGHAIVFSGVAVALGLVTMMVLPIPFMRSLGFGGTLIALSSVAASVTLLPIILAHTGRRLDRRGRGAHLMKERDAGRFWTAWARGVVRLKWVVGLGTGALLIGLSAIGLTAHLGLPESGNLARSGEGREALTTLERAGVPSGVLTPIEVLVPAGVDPAGVRDTLAGTDGVHDVVVPDSQAWRRDGTALIAVVPVDEGGTEKGEATVKRVTSAVPDGVQIGGYVAQSLDFRSHTYGTFPIVLGLVGLVTLVVLARAFRSLLLPIKAVVMNLLSLGAIMGAMVVLWQWGWGTEQLLGIQPTGSMGEFIPLTIFAFLYGLSMDYEVFILARMREEYDVTGVTRDAVIEGVARTGRLVTCAALILFSSFAALAATPEFDVKVFATGLGLGILLDATLVRGLLLPATVAMMGRWNWWLPVWAARLLRVEPSPPSHVDPPRQDIGELAGKH